MRVAIVGTGGVALRHLGVLAPMTDVEVVGHLSSEVGRAQTQASQWGGGAFTNLSQLLDATRPDAVWICVTPDRHGPLEHTLISRRVPFFVEKPLSVDLSVAEDIARAVYEAPLVTAVGYKFRALDTLPRVRALLAETPPRMAIAAWHDAMPPPAWWRHNAQSGGQVVEQATHLLDLARVLLGSATVVSAATARWPRSDAPDSDVPDVTTAHLQFGEVPGVLTATCLLRGRQAIHLQLFCEGRVLTISDRALVISTGPDVTRVKCNADPFATEDAAFIEAVRTDDPSRVLCDYADALESHRLAVEITRRSTHHPPAASSP